MLGGDLDKRPGLAQRQMTVAGGTNRRYQIQTQETRCLGQNVTPPAFKGPGEL